MNQSLSAVKFLLQETRSLLGRLDRIRPFSLTMPAVAGAAASRRVLLAIEQHLARQQHELRKRIQEFIQWLIGPDGQQATPEQQQRRLTLLRLQFNATLDQLDIFADVLTQRAEHETGVWLAGLDMVAADSLSLPARFFTMPPLVTYLDRGHGAAIRRARTRLPGGPKNPVTLVRLPRERMIGSGIGASLVHEIGHQGAALLDLVSSLREVLKGRAQKFGSNKPIWDLWGRWISEIIADFWSMAKIGVGATIGLIGVVSLLRAFVFRVNLDDPHPFPWIRVKLSCAMGRMLYPDPQWDRLAHLWDSLYPTAKLSTIKRRLTQMLESTLPDLVKLLINHQPKALKGKSLREVMPVVQRQPTKLRELLRAWHKAPKNMCYAPPTLTLAVLGQGRADHTIDPECEGRLLNQLLQFWPLYGKLDSDTVSHLLSGSFISERPRVSKSLFEIR